MFEKNETNTNANGQSQSQVKPPTVNAAILEDGALENPDDIIAEQHANNFASKKILCGQAEGVGDKFSLKRLVNGQLSYVSSHFGLRDSYP